MPAIQLDAKNIQWPEMCCRCGGKNFSYRPHTDKVVIATILSVTTYRRISLNIPVCTPCSNAHYLWFGAATVAAAIGGLILFLNKDPNNPSNFILYFWILAIVLAIVGTRKKPVRILKYDEKKNVLTIKIYNKEVAKMMPKLR